MRKIKGVNWSEVVRKAIIDRIRFEEALQEGDRARIEEAVRELDELRTSLEARYGRSNYDSAETIRAWRDRQEWSE